jgi:nucleoside-diphosphate-sugar epimerase
MRNFLVTGGAGFIGSCMAERLAIDPNIKVVVVDNFITGAPEKLPNMEQYPNVRFIKCDVNKYEDIASVFYAYKFEYVFHYAALVGVKRTLQNPVAVLEDVKGLENILRLSKNTRVKRVFYSSSSEVYGEPVEFPQNENTTPLNSRLPYAVVKNLGEAYLKSYQQEFDLNYTIFRFFNTYGPKQSKEFVVSRFINLALKNEDITVYGDGSQTRTFCYIDDNIEACYNTLGNTNFVNEVINVGGNEEISILTLAQTIKNLTGSSSQIVHLPPLAEGDMTRRLPDVVKMNQLLNRPKTPLEVGLKKILDNPGFIVG